MSEESPPPYEPKLIHLPGTRLTPEVVLHRTLAKLDNIKSVNVIIQWKDDTFSTDHSSQRVSELTMGVMVVDQEVRDIVFRKNES